MTKLSKPVATIETLKRLVTNSNNKYATKDSLSTVATTGNYSDLKGTPTSLPANGGNASTVNGHTVLSNVPANAKFTDTVYTHPSTHPASMITGLATVATSGSYNDLSNKPTIPTTLPANGGTATNANNIAITLTNPSTATTYYVPFLDGASGNKAGRGNDGIRYYTREGTTNATGTAELGLGNSVSAGIAGNKVGAIYMYGTGKGYTYLRTNNTSDNNYTAYLPNKNGTIALTTDIPTSLPANGGNASTVNGHTVLSNVPANAKFTDTVYTHPNSGVTAGTYKSVTVNAQGHVTAGTNPTTLSGYGITDAKISNGVITLGANSITPLTNHQSLANYYTKSEVNSQISSIPKFAIAVVTNLPTSNISNTTIYLKKTGDDTQNLYTEYIYVNSKWEQLGTQKLDLSGYLTKTDASNTYLGKTATAANASKLVLDQGTANTARPVIFQDSNLSTSALTACYNNNLTYNPETNNLVVGKINGFTLNSSVPANAKFTDTVYTHPSTHPASMITGLAKVATSGSYNDLSNKPTIPTSLPANGGNSTTVNNHTVNSDVPANAKFTDTVYSLPDATTTTKGGVKVGSNLTVASGTISLTKANVTGALGYTPPTTNTTYTAGTGISLSGTTINNSGVRTITAGSNANQINVNTNGTSSTITINNVANASSSNTSKKLETSRNISLGTGVTSSATKFDGSSDITIPVTSIKESYLEWGGKNLAGAYGPIDAAMVPELGANRLAFGKADGITVQYSTNGGTTWVDYGLTNNQKIAMFSTGNYGCTIGKANTSSLSTNCMLRVSIDTDKFSVYTALNKFVILVSTNGCSGCYCTIDASLESSPSTFKTFVNKAVLSGWSGYNVINSPDLITYGNENNKDWQYGIVRFTFGCTGVNKNYPGLSILKIMGFGGVGWTTPSNLAKNGMIYSYDENQNAYFPAKIRAASFEGSASSVNGITPDWTGELGYNDTNWICAWQSDGKKIKAMNKSVFAASNHTHNYAGSSSAGGAATSANKLNTNAGSTTQPVYFTNGVPTACTGISVATVTATTTLNIPGGKIWIE